MQIQSISKQVFPKTLEEFKEHFQDEKTSLEYLFAKRWSQGFICPYCSWHNEDLAPTKSMVCSHCGHPTSITTNTIMHGTKKPISQWLLCIWWLTSSSGGYSAKDLQRLLNLSSYQTAWTWLQKLRMAMSIADNKKCCKTVEVSSESISLGGNSSTESNILAAAEIILPAGFIGRIKMASIELLNKETVNSFLNDYVEKGSSIIFQEDDCYRGIDRNDFISVSSSALYRTRQVIESFELWINKIHRGGVAAKHLQLYLDEFCFHSNAAMLADREAVFNLLLSGVLSKKSLSYKNITSQSTKR
jgi:hypothetical protein